MNYINVTNHINAIKAASNHIELDNAVENAALTLNCDLDGSVSYAEEAEIFKEKAARLLAMTDILLAAESRWFEIEA